MNWQEMPELTGVSLTDSFVLGWDATGQEITISLDFALCSDHPAYSPLHEGEWACFKAGTLRFVGVTSVVGLPSQESVRVNTDAAGETDYGEIETLDRDGRIYIIGFEFGEAIIHADAVTLVLAEHNNSLQGRRP